MAKKIQNESSGVHETTISLFEENSTSDTKKTFIIFGVGRGGTTMVAGVAKLCGLDIGQDLPINLEDNDFNIHVLTETGDNPIERLLSAIKQRNESKDVWGWKFPRAIAYLAHIHQYLVNPHLIVVSRDPIATATRAILLGTPKVKAIERVLRQQLRNMELVEQWEAPALIVSYEKAIHRPERFISDLCQFMDVGKPTDTTEILAFMEPGRYKPL